MPVEHTDHAPGVFASFGWKLLVCSLLITQFERIHHPHTVTLRAMPLSESQKKYLRGLGHDLKPLIMVGDAGLSASLMAEYESTLAHHELIKVRVRVGDRAARDAIIDELCAFGSAELIQRVGNIALVYRENADEKKITIPSR